MFIDYHEKIKEDFMTNLSVNISAELMAKLEKIANKSGRSKDECLELALAEYVDNFEDFYQTDLNSVDQLERSFFLSIGE